MKKMDSPYGPPEVKPDESPDPARSKKMWFRAVWAFAIAAVVPPMIGIAGTVIGMLSAFNELGQTGKADPEALAGEISFSLLTTAWGLVLSFFAVIGFVVSLVVFLKKKRALQELENGGQPGSGR